MLVVAGVASKPAPRSVATSVDGSAAVTGKSQCVRTGARPPGWKSSGASDAVSSSPRRARRANRAPSNVLSRRASSASRGAEGCSRMRR